VISLPWAFPSELENILFRMQKWVKMNLFLTAMIYQGDPNSSESLDFKDCPDLADYLFN